MTAKRRTGNTKKITVEEVQEGRRDTTAPALSDVVTVAMNWPTGITFEVETASGGVEKVTFAGNSIDLRGRDMGILPVGAFGLTRNVPRELWEAVEKKYLSCAPFDALVKKGLIFASGSARDASDEAAERKDTRNGAEPIDPTKVNTKESKDTIGN